MGPDSKGFPPRPDRSSPQALLTDWFERAYTQQDSALYKEMLDGAFEFEFIPRDADSLRNYLGSENAWGRDIDVASTLGLFESAIVADVSLDIGVLSETEFTGDGCDSCRMIVSTVTLRVRTTETINGTPRVLAVDSQQEFIVKRDPTVAGEWVLSRQKDVPRGKRSPRELGGGETPRTSATEATTWGMLKGLNASALPVIPLTCSALGIPLSGLAPLEVGFGGTFSGGHGPYTFHWEFGDGGTSAFLYPSYIFKNSGSYSAVFIVRDAQATPRVCRDTLRIEVSEAPPVRSSPELLLTSWFEWTYEHQDSAMYEAMLADYFRFEFIDDDADSLRHLLGYSDNAWGRELDLRSTGALFRMASGIQLDIQVDSERPCFGCRAFETTITLRVEIDSPTGPPVTFEVDSPQAFVVFEDPFSPGEWVLWLQHDRPSMSRQASASMVSLARVSTSWGRLKGDFYQ